LAKWPPETAELNIIEIIWAIMKHRAEAEHPTTLPETKGVALDA
jgi:hypothetical protein